MSFKRRNLMKIVLLLLGVALFAGSILAGELPYSDPRIGLGKGTGGSTPLASFESNVSGGGVSGVYTNDTDSTFFDISITTQDVYSGIPTYDFFCVNYSPWYFSTCSITRQYGTITFLFSNPSGEGEGDDGDPSGILPGEDFQLSLKDAVKALGNPDGGGGWGSYQSFSGVANTPEPGTITLFVSFLGILAAKGKFRRQPSSSA
jgi:hypothetical protein